MVVVQPGDDRHVTKIVREPKWSRSSPSVIVLESEDGNKGTSHQKRVRQRRKSLTDTRTTLYSLSETLQTTTWPSSPLYLIPGHLAPTRYTWLQRISTCIFLDILLREAYYMRMRIPSRYSKCVQQDVIRR